jgi:hypothetical protein
MSYYSSLVCETKKYMPIHFCLKRHVLKVEQMAMLAKQMSSSREKRNGMKASMCMDKEKNHNYWELFIMHMINNGEPQAIKHGPTVISKGKPNYELLNCLLWRHGLLFIYWRKHGLKHFQTAILISLLRDMCWKA